MGRNPYIKARRVEAEDILSLPTYNLKEEALKADLKLIPPKPKTPPQIMEVLYLSRAPKVRGVINVGTTPTLILSPPHETPYLIQNPATIAGLTTTSKLKEATVTADGVSDTLGVANYLYAYLWLDVTAYTSGTWNFTLQSKYPFADKWVDIQDIFTADIAGIGTYRADTGQFGLATDIRIRWTGSGSITFTLACTLKSGLAGSSTGLAKTIYIGGSDVSTNFGYPLVEGGEKVLALAPDMALYAIAETTVPIKVFVL